MLIDADEADYAAFLRFLGFIRPRHFMALPSRMPEASRRFSLVVGEAGANMLKKSESEVAMPEASRRLCRRSVFFILPFLFSITTLFEWKMLHLVYIGEFVVSE